MVSLQTSSGSHFCGGTLISDKWVLTAAHCGDVQQVQIGAHKLNGDVDPCVETIQVARTIPHPAYNDGTVENDISILELVRPSSYPVAQVNNNPDLELPETTLTISGWGTLNQNDFFLPETLQKVQVPVAEQSICKSQYGGGIVDSMMCAGFVGGGKDSCQGDSGGPLFDDATNTIVGITSWGNGCAQANYFGVYTRISSFDTWIKNVIGQVPPLSPTPMSPTVSPAQCSLSSDLLTYTGTVSFTESGVPCRPWSEEGWSVDGNACSNPDSDLGGPWCFVPETSITNWEYCNVGTPAAPICTNSQLTQPTQPPPSPPFPTPSPPPSPTPSPAAPTPQPPPSIDVCQEATRIVGGDDAAPREFPFIVSLQSFGTAYCGGTLISPTHVMTAAHCEVGVGEIAVMGMDQKSQMNVDGCVEKISVSQVITHPNYDGNTLENDIAILVLSQPSRYAAFVPSLSSNAPLAPTPVTAIGWGTLSSGGSSPDTLQKVTVPTVDRSECNDLYNGEILNTMICAGDVIAGGKDACQGDSGGPLITGTSSGGDATLVGITSWGYGCADSRYPGVYTDVSVFSGPGNFICSNIDDQHPSCGSTSRSSRTSTSPSFKGKAVNETPADVRSARSARTRSRGTRGL